MYGIIDIGSNTMRLSCYKVVDKKMKYVFHKKKMVGLASYVDEENNLSEKGIKKAQETLLDFKTIITSVGLDEIYVIATASLRNINNSDTVLQVLKKNTILPIKILSEEEEAVYEFRGANANIKLKNCIMMDVGGGSTEIVFCKDSEILQTESIPIGSLNIYKNFVKGIMPTRTEIKKIYSDVKKRIKDIDCNEEVHVALGVGGTARAIYKIQNELFQMPAKCKEVEISQLNELLTRFIEKPEDIIKKVLQIAPERIHTIVPGLLIIKAIMERFGCENMVVSKWGVREGYVLSRLIS